MKLKVRVPGFIPTGNLKNLTPGKVYEAEKSDLGRGIHIIKDDVGNKRSITLASNCEELHGSRWNLVGTWETGEEDINLTEGRMTYTHKKKTKKWKKVLLDIKNTLLNILLAFVAVVLFFVLTPVSLLYVMFKFGWRNFKGYFLSQAIAIDRFGNYNFRAILNATMRKSGGTMHGDFRETISSVLGKNKLSKDLSAAGLILAWILDLLDKDHCIKSINNNLDDQEEGEW